MDDLGNIVYVLIGVGWFLLNAYKKSQQNKQKPVKRRSAPKPTAHETARTESASKSLEDIILEQLGGSPEEEKRFEPVSSSEHENQDKFLNKDLTHSHLSQDYVMGKSEMESHRVKRQVKPLKVEENEQQDGLMDRLFPEGFDLQQAVVLNAILDRPYK